MIIARLQCVRHELRVISVSRRGGMRRDWHCRRTAKEAIEIFVVQNAQRFCGRFSVFQAVFDRLQTAKVQNILR
jgi:uncharacterized NAD(P)/FAD-binding protein YdhS